MELIMTWDGEIHRVDLPDGLHRVRFCRPTKYNARIQSEAEMARVFGAYGYKYYSQYYQAYTDQEEV